MKNFPAAFAVQKNLKTGAAPVWILKITVAGVDYYLSDNAFLIPPWGVTTKRWVKSWGTVTEGISGLIDEYKISDLSVTCFADPDASPNIVDLALNSDLEKNVCSLYFWFAGCADPPQEMFRGYVRDYPVSGGDTIVTLELQDETLKWERSYVGRKVTPQDYPHADPDDVGRIMPLVYGSVEKLPALAVDAGVQTSLSATLSSTATSVKVSDATDLAAGMVVQVDAEQMLISAIAGSTLTVQRGCNSTLADAHQKAAIVWECKANFFYVAAGQPVSQIPKAYCSVGQIALDISAVCTAWPAGDHPDYPGLAVIAVPGYITVEQAISLALDDGIQVTNGTLGSALSGNVTRSGSVTLAGLVALIGDLLDPGHTHNTGQSSSENTTTGLPTGNPPATAASNGGYYGPYLDFPADGARSDASYTVTCKFLLSANIAAPVRVYFSIYGVQATVLYYYDWYGSGGVVRNGDSFTVSFSAGSANTNRIYVYTYALGYGTIGVTAASRTIMLTSLVSSASSSGINNRLDIDNTLSLLDQLGIDRGTLEALLSGTIARQGTVSLSGNSVANTLVGDRLMVDVVSSVTAPADVVFDILQKWTPVDTMRLIGEFPAGYAFNGAITDYRLALEVIHELAWQCRAWFRHFLGSGVMIVRSLNPASVKTLGQCRVQDGKRVHDRRKSDYTEIINTINLLYDRDWTKSSGDAAYKAVSKDVVAGSVQTFGVQERPELFRCDFITSGAMADDVRAFYLAYYAVRHWVHTFESYYYDSELEFGDGVMLGFADGVYGEVQEVGFDPGGDVIKIRVVQ